MGSAYTCRFSSKLNYAVAAWEGEDTYLLACRRMEDENKR